MSIFGPVEIYYLHEAHMLKELRFKVVGVLMAKPWDCGRAISVLVCMREAAYEVVKWWFWVFQWTRFTVIH